jgi:Zn-dependent protease with chaperone function
MRSRALAPLAPVIRVEGLGVRGCAVTNKCIHSVKCDYVRPEASACGSLRSILPKAILFLPTMSTTQSQPSFIRSFVLPAFWIFLIPVLGLLFFMHVRKSYDDQYRDSILKQIKTDGTLSDEERQEASKFYSEVPASRLVMEPKLKDMFTDDARNDYWQFRWLIRTAFGSIVLSIAAFLGVGLCVLMSLKSQLIQYYSLLAGWHALKMVGILQTLAQGLLLFAMSYWVPAFWFNFFVPKLTFIVGMMAVIGTFVVLMAFFKRLKSNMQVTGFRVDELMAKQLWKRLQSICSTLKTDFPQNVLVGIDDNFFVTEQPIIANGKKLTGRTLFVSLPLLKQLNGAEADAVMAHEMAHFAGKDTLYSKKITPLLNRYGHYLTALQTGGVTLPVFYFMSCFRALYELSLGKLNREREFRADQVATQFASPRDLAGALIRTTAYTQYRGIVQNELFQDQKVLEDANICERIESGFSAYAEKFAQVSDLEKLQTSHPFDSHPAIAARLERVGFKLDRNEVTSLLARPGDGAWFHEIERGSEIERAQWDEFEESFREAHAQTLPYRYLPSTDEEREIVTTAFPKVQFMDKKGALTIDYEKFSHPDWPAPIYFHEITNCTNSEGTLIIQYLRDGKKKQSIKSGSFKKEASAMLLAFQNYYGRHLAAVAFQQANGIFNKPNE